MFKNIHIKYRKVSVNAIASLLQTIIVGICYFFLYKYLLRHLGVRELGLWSLIVASTSVVSMGNMGIGGSVVKFVAASDAYKDYKKITAIIHTSLVIVLPIIGILCVILYFALPVILAYAVKKSLYSLALQLIPLALVNFFINAIAGIFQSTIDGIQFIYIRNFISSCLVILYLGLVFYLVPSYGLIGVVYSQIIQSFLTIVAFITVVFKKVPEFSLIKMRISKNIFKELFGYGINFQVMTISTLFFDPITKYFLSKYGGLDITGYYEMAGKFVLQVRALIVSSLNAIVPAVASVYAKGFANIKELYLKWFPYLFLVTLVLITGIISFANYISVIWIGKLSIAFVFILIIYSFGTFFNIITTYAYFIDLGTGDLKWNVISHIVATVANIILCFLFGKMYGGFNVVMAPALATIIGTFILLIPFNKQYDIKFKELFNHRTRSFLLASFLCIGGSYSLFHFTSDLIPFYILFLTNILFFIVIWYLNILKRDTGFQYITKSGFEREANHIEPS
jgi:O-antigen/teichoic acid export membrane protein